MEGHFLCEENWNKHRQHKRVTTSLRWLDDKSGSTREAQGIATLRHFDCLDPPHMKAYWMVAWMMNCLAALTSAILASFATLTPSGNYQCMGYRDNEQEGA